MSSILGIAAKTKKSLDSLRGKSQTNNNSNNSNNSNNGSKGNNQSGNNSQTNNSGGTSKKKKSPGGSNGSATYQSQKEAEKAFSDAFDRYSEKALSSMLKSARTYAQAASSVNADSVSTSTAIRLGQTYIAGLLEEPK